MIKKLLLALLSCLAIGSVSSKSMAADAPTYDQGPVTRISLIKIKYGHENDYMKYLDSSWKAENEAYKKAGIITEYHVYLLVDGSTSEANCYLSVTFPNMAALDTMDNKMDKVDAELGRTSETTSKGIIDRNAIREVMGSKLMREALLK
jgi:hypothetical protein